MDEALYLQKWRQLQIDMEMLRPMQHDELLKSADLLKDFGKLWARCQTKRAQRELIQQILDKVVVIHNEVITLGLKKDTALLMETTRQFQPVGKEGLEPSPPERHNPKSCASANSATPPNQHYYSATDQCRTRLSPASQSQLTESPRSIHHQGPYPPHAPKCS